MRLYTFCNPYLSRIQCGIQSAHVVHELFVKYAHMGSYFEGDPMMYKLMDWAKVHKTMVVCAAQLDPHLETVYTQLEHVNKTRPIPFAKFHEPGIGNALTVVGVVIDSNIIEYNVQLRDKKYDRIGELAAGLAVGMQLSKMDVTLANLIASFPKA